MSDAIDLHFNLESIKWMVMNKNYLKAENPNQATFITDMHMGTGSWFVVSNVKAGDYEFGLLTHHISLPNNDTATTVAITDVTNSKYYVDERKEGSIKENEQGFEVQSGNLH